MTAGTEAEPAPAPAEELSPGELLLGFLDGTLSRLANRPLRLRMRTSPSSALRGRIDVLILEVRELEIAGFPIDRLLMRAENVRIEPGLPARFKAAPVGMKARVLQSGIDRWTHATHLPLRLRLTDEGIVASAGLRGRTVSEVTTELSVSGRFVRLHPLRARMLGVAAPVMPTLPGYLPLPPLPLGARITKVTPAEGELTLWLALSDVDEALTAGVALRIARRLRTIPANSLGG
ncbi:MAG: hypothetical protein QOK06_1249 [Acidimicrobiaceae bacterium]|jgi:hypothetical protein